MIVSPKFLFVFFYYLRSLLGILLCFLLVGGFFVDVSISWVQFSLFIFELIVCGFGWGCRL